MNRLLVIQLAKLGDFIQSTPLLAALRSAWPGRGLTLAAGEAAVLEAARLSPLLEEVLAVGPGRPEPEGEYEAVFNLNSAPAAARLSGRVRAGLRFGPTMAEDDTLRFAPAQEFIMGLMAEDRRLVRFNLADVWLALAPEAGPRPLFWPPPENTLCGPEPRAGLNRGAQPHWPLPEKNRGPGLRVGLHLGAKHHLRRWPVENFVRLALALGRRLGEFTPVLTGAAEEKALGAKFEKLGPPALNLMGKTSLSELSRVLAGLDLLVSADTGALHLAAALGTPALALFFGPAYGPETGPYGPGHLIYQAEAICGPCREGSCRRRQCLALPEPEVAARLAGDLLAGRPPEAQVPPGHRVWRTGSDVFGQELTPVGRPALTAEEALALALTWAGQAVFRPGFTPRPAGLSAQAAHYAPPGGRLTLEPGRFRRLIGRLGPAVGERLRQGFDILGLKIA